MKLTKLLAAFVLIASLSSLAFTGIPDSKKVDTTKSQLSWKAYKVTGAHEGTIGIQSGELNFDDGQLKGGNFTIDMTSINVTDLEGEWKGKLEGHLKSDDFFGVATYPTATFVITNVASRGKAGDYRITGNLTIKGKTKSIKFNANILEQDGGAKATADIKLDRTDFDVRYGSGSFFDNLGDKTIYDEFDLSIVLITQ